MCGNSGETGCCEQSLFVDTRGCDQHQQHQQFSHTHLLGQVNTMKQNVSNVMAGIIFLMLSLTFTCAYTAPIMARVVNVMHGMKNGSYTMPITSKKAKMGLSILITWYTPSVNPASANSCDNVCAFPTRYADAVVVLTIQINMIDMPMINCNMSDSVKSIVFMVILYTESTVNSSGNMPHGVFQWQHDGAKIQRG